MNIRLLSVFACIGLGACTIAPQDESSAEGTQPEQAKHTEQALNGGSIGVQVAYVPLAGPPCTGEVEALGDGLSVKAKITFELYRNDALVATKSGDFDACAGATCLQPYWAFPVNSAGEYKVKYKATTKWGLIFNLNYNGESTVLDVGNMPSCPTPVFPQPPPFAWSSAGPIAHMFCANINEGADHHTWSDNYFCSAQDYGLRFSGNGPIAGMTCVLVNEPGDPDTWTDNYLCNSAGLKFSWSYDGPLAGRSCTRWSESADPDGWDDNYLCR